MVIHRERKIVIKESTSPSTGEVKKVPVTRWQPFVHQIFNLDQTTLSLPKEEIPQWKFPGVETAEEVMALYTECPPKFRNSSEAYYIPRKKEIHLPPRSSFKTEAIGIHVEMHEEGHSS